LSSGFDVSERAGDLRETVVAHRPRRAVAASFRDGERPALRGIAFGFAEPALADDGAGSDDRQVGARWQLLWRKAAVIGVSVAGEDRVGVFGADGKDQGGGHGVLP